MEKEIIEKDKVLSEKMKEEEYKKKLYEMDQEKERLLRKTKEDAELSVDKLKIQHEIGK